MNKALIMMFFTTVMAITSFFGAKFGYAVNGAVAVAKDRIVNPFDMIDFFWRMISFQIDDMPYVISLVFIVMSVTIVYILLPHILHAIDIITPNWL